MMLYTGIIVTDHNVFFLKLSNVISLKKWFLVHKFQPTRLNSGIGKDDKPRNHLRRRRAAECCVRRFPYSIKRTMGKSCGVLRDVRTTRLFHN